MVGDLFWMSWRKDIDESGCGGCWGCWWVFWWLVGCCWE